LSSSAEELYDRSAAAWARREPSSVSDFTARPAVIELCRPFAGLRVLDLGCGEGYCSRILRQSGAGEVFGIDVSSRMIDAARREEERAPLGIRYAVGDACNLAEVAAGSFDVVLAMFLFNYLNVSALTTCMRELVRVLKPGGRFVFAVPHPSLPWLLPARPPFYFDVQGQDYFGARDQLFAGKIWKRDGTPLDVQLVHKTLEDYFGALRVAGFSRLPQLLELRVTPEISAIDPTFFAPLLGMPLHLAVAIERA
jgi:SAM-dependent methyltransferase